MTWLCAVSPVELFIEFVTSDSQLGTVGHDNVVTLVQGLIICWFVLPRQRQGNAGCQPTQCSWVFGSIDMVPDSSDTDRGLFAVIVSNPKPEETAYSGHILFQVSGTFLYGRISEYDTDLALFTGLPKLNFSFFFQVEICAQVPQRRLSQKCPLMQNVPRFEKKINTPKHWRLIHKSHKHTVT